MATAPSPNELTRQQLDELDALLQRMLALPLNPPETPAVAAKAAEPLPPVAANWRVDPPTPAPAPHLLLTAVPLPLPDPLPEPAPPEPVVERAAAPEPVRVVAPRLADGPVASWRPKPDLPPLPPQPPADTAPPTPWKLVPLVAVNRLTDRVLGAFGPVGKALRSGVGRNAFGVAGVLLLAYTAAHVAQQQGWLALPFPLPWPR